MSVTGVQSSLQNLLVPAGGTVHAVNFSGTFSASPQLIDWQQFKIDNFPFNPYGAFINNTLGTVNLVVTILPFNWVITVPPGQQRAVNFPAPQSSTATIVGDPVNMSSVIFVDFPVFPDNGGNFGGSVDAIIPAEAPGGLPYRVQTLAPASGHVAGTLATAGGTTITLAPPSANQNLSKLRLAFTSDAIGPATISITANAIGIFSETIKLPLSEPITLDFSDIGIPLAAGNIVVTVNTALTAGTLSANAWTVAP